MLNATRVWRTWRKSGGISRLHVWDGGPSKTKDPRPPRPRPWIPLAVLIACPGPKKVFTKMAFEDEKAATQHVADMQDDMSKAPATIEANVASVALTEAVNARKPSLWSTNMLKLYGIMGIGYLVSTMNGFDSSLMSASLEEHALDLTSDLHSGEPSTRCPATKQPLV